MSPKTAVAKREAFDWSKASDEQVAKVFPIVLKGLNPDFFTKAGQRHAIAERVQGKNPDEVVAEYRERTAAAQKKAVSEVPDEIMNLSIEELQDVLTRTGSKINVTAKYDKNTYWKAYSILHKRLDKNHLSLAEAKIMTAPISGTGTRWSVDPLDLTNRANNGIHEAGANFVEQLKALDKDIKFGRNKSGTRAMVNIMLPNVLPGSLIYITLPAEYKVDKPKRERKAKVKVKA